jgi:hypothetical protein
VQVRLLVHPEVDLPALDVLDGLGHVRGHGAGLRVRHEAARAEDAGDPPDLGHLVRGGDGGVEVQPALLDARDQVLGAHGVRAGGLRLGRLVAGREDDHTGGLAGAVRQVHRAADHLVRLARVHTQPHRDLDGGVHLRGGGGLLRQVRRLERAVEPLAVDQLGVLAVVLAALHVLSSDCGSVVVTSRAGSPTGACGLSRRR